MSTIVDELPHLHARSRARVPSVVLEFSSATTDRKWDAFVASAASGSYMQTSMWAEAKRNAGWHACRVVVRRGGVIVGGAQLLMRTWPVIGGVGYVPGGPVLATDDPALMLRVLDAVRELTRQRSLHYVLLQPPRDLPQSMRVLETRGLHKSLVQPTPMATAIVDLSASIDDIMAGMKSRTRHNVRLGLRRGIEVREGTAADVSVFHRLMLATAHRNHFTTQSESYLYAVWNAFAPRGCAKLLIAEHEAIPIAAVMVLCVGQTATCWRSAWSGEHGSLHPNEALQWKAIEWAKERDCRAYDMDGIQLCQVDDREAGRADTAFKLGFGSRAVVYPRAVELIQRPAMRLAVSAAMSSSVAKLRGELVVMARGARHG